MCEGSWKTTRSMGWECTAGDRRSGPVPTADRLTTPTRRPLSHTAAGRRWSTRFPDHSIDDAVTDPLASDPPIEDASDDVRGRGSPLESTTRPARHDSPREPAGPVPALRDRHHRDCSRPARPDRPPGDFSGDHTGGVTPVPIPNTAVKPVGPMIVPLARKSVIAGILSANHEPPQPKPGCGGGSLR